jgi:hypothetical protein
LGVGGGPTSGHRPIRAAAVAPYGGGSGAVDRTVLPREYMVQKIRKLWWAMAVVAAAMLVAAACGGGGGSNGAGA